MNTSKKNSLSLFILAAVLLLPVFSWAHPIQEIKLEYKHKEQKLVVEIGYFPVR